MITPASGALADPVGPAARKGFGRTSALSRSQARWGWIFIGPAIVGFVVFVSGPMLASLIIGMTNWTIGVSPSFTGFANFQQISHDSIFWASIRATLYFALLSVPLLILVAFTVALLLNRVKRGRGFFRTVFYLPVLMPPAASSVVWLWVFAPDQGLANTVLGYFGLPKMQWIYDANTVVPSLALVAAWGFGNMALIFLSAVQGVPRELLEAAECDGAGPLRRLWHVTIPHTSPIILFNLVTGLIAAFQSFDFAFVMTSGGPNNASYFYVFYIYRAAFTNGTLGYASALAWILFVIVLIVTLVVFRFVRNFVYYEGKKT